MWAVKALDSKEKVYLLSMDMSKPFDSLHHSLTLAKLNTGGFSDTGSLDLRWPEPIYMRVGYVLICVFQNERFNRFL